MHRVGKAADDAVSEGFAGPLVDGGRRHRRGRAGIAERVASHHEAAPRCAWKGRDGRFCDVGAPATTAALRAARRAGGSAVSMQPPAPPAPAPAPPTTTVRRVATLDGLRGIALLLVLQHHFYGLSSAVSGYPETLALDRAAHAALSPLWTGLDLFFVLSGYLITGILLDAKGSRSYYAPFLLRRLLRVVPAYYAFLAFVLVVCPLFPPLARVASVDALREAQGWFWGFAVNVYVSLNPTGVDAPMVHSHLWSLAMEEQYYLLWPFVVRALPLASLARFCGVVAAGALAFRVFLLAWPIDALIAPRAVFALLPARADLLALGAFVAVAARRPGGLAALAPTARVVAGACLAALAAIFVARHGLDPVDPVVSTAGFSLVAAGWSASLVLVLSAGDGAVTRALSHPVLVFLGRHSYATYIVHLLVAYAALDAIHRAAAAAGVPPVFSVAGSFVPCHALFSLAMTVVVSLVGWGAWPILEEPFARLRRRIA